MLSGVSFGKLNFMLLSSIADFRLGTLTFILSCWTRKIEDLCSIYFLASLTVYHSGLWVSTWYVPFSSHNSMSTMSQ